MADSSPIALLHDKLRRKLGNGQGVHLSPEEVDWLVLSGAYRTLVLAAADEMFMTSRRRIEAQGQHQEDVAALTEAYQNGGLKGRIAPSSAATPNAEPEADASTT